MSTNSGNNTCERIYIENISLSLSYLYGEFIFKITVFKRELVFDPLNPTQSFHKREKKNIISSLVTEKKTMIKNTRIKSLPSSISILVFWGLEIKVYIGSLFILISCNRWLLMSLKPSVELSVVSP